MSKNRPKYLNFGNVRSNIKTNKIDSYPTEPNRTFHYLRETKTVDFMSYRNVDGHFFGHANFQMFGRLHNN